MSKTRVGKLPEPTGGGDFDPFLKAGDIGKLGTKAKIKVLGGPEETPDSEYSDMQLPVSFKGKRYALGLKDLRGKLRALVQNVRRQSEEMARDRGSGSQALQSQRLRSRGVRGSTPLWVRLEIGQRNCRMIYEGTCALAR